MAQLIDVLRAKSKKDEHYLLKEHVRDALERAVQIREFINKNGEYIEYNFLKSEETFKNLAKALFLHDMGKIDYGFQKKVFSKDEKRKDNEEWQMIKGFFTIPEGKDSRYLEIRDHEILSVIHTVMFLDNDDWSKKIRTAILLHHYNKFFVEREQHITRILEDYPDVKEYISFMIEKKEQLTDMYQQLIAYLKDEFRENKSAGFVVEALDELTINKENLDSLKEKIDIGIGVSTVLPLYELYDKKDEDRDILEFFVFLGLLRRCDYSASAGPDVHAENPLSIVDDIMNDLPEKIKDKINKDKIWQEEIVERYKNKEDIILIAPTGSGKTEFALLWAKEKGKKLFYTLPLRVALNDLFNRFSGEKGYFDESHVGLLHSTAFIEYLEKEKHGGDISIGTKLKEVKMFASPILLTTPDQVFLASLKYYGFDKLLSLYPASTVVIDEIQAYDPEMAAIIIKTMKMIKEVEGNLLIITATFPPYFDVFLTGREIKELNLQKVDLKNEKDNLSQEIKNYDVRRHKLAIKEEAFVQEKKDENTKNNIYEINRGVLEKIINSTDHENDNILIIVNNVMKAINLFKELASNPPRNTEFIKLLHSRLVEKEKKERIKKIKGFLEKKGKKNKRIIVVSTQIVEASVDFDFDVLITEISPIDSQVQRWGRIYRNREKEGDYKNKKPNIYIFIDKKDSNGRYEYDSGTKAVYKPSEVLDKTIEIIKETVERKGENDPLGYEDERNMIEDVYTSPEIEQIYKKKIDEALQWLDIYHASKKSEAQRIFRRLMGTHLIIPHLLTEKGEDEHIKKMGEMLERKDYRSWKELTEDVFGEDYKQEDKLKILRWMYEYSIPAPEYAIRTLGSYVREVLGFHILPIKKEKISDVYMYGLDVLKNQDLDEFLDRQNVT